MEKLIVQEAMKKNSRRLAFEMKMEKDSRMIVVSTKRQNGWREVKEFAQKFYMSKEEFLKDENFVAFKRGFPLKKVLQELAEKEIQGCWTFL